MIIKDTLIVGQGLSGSLLANELLNQGESLVIIDTKKEQTASKVAIGLVNPITGKRLVKSWMIEQLLPVAKQLYQQLEKEANQPFIVPANIARIIPNEAIFEQWKPNFEQAVQDGFIDPHVKTIELNQTKQDYFTILQSFWLRTKPLLEHLEQKIKQKTIYKEEEFDFSALEKKKEGWIYKKEIHIHKIIFCDGARGKHNPFTSHLPFNLNKGEVISVEIQDYTFPHILKKNIFVVPDGDTHRIGSTYDREFTSEEITTQALNYFKTKATDIGIHQFHLLDHQAAVRPATVDRRPFIGALNEENTYIFNGFGAKGVSLIPYFVHHFCDHLFEGKELNKEIDSRRYQLK